MKNITAIAAILLASLGAAATASAQDHAAKANIPFGFYVNNKWVPAGEYTLTSDSRSPNVITIRGENSSVALLSLGHTVDRQPGSSSLVFKKYGDQYFLNEIRCAACRMSVGFTPSKREKEAGSNETHIAAPTDVYLALK